MSFVSHHLGILLIAHVVAVFVFDSLCQESECGHVKRLAIWASHLFHHRITHNIWLMHTNHTVQNSQRGITSSNFEVIWRSPSLKHNTFASAAYARQTNTGKSRNVMRPAARRLSRRPDHTNISKPTLADDSSLISNSRHSLGHQCKPSSRAHQVNSRS